MIERVLPYQFDVAGRNPTNAAKFASFLLAEVFGFASLAAVAPIARGERTFPIGHAALGGRVPVVIAPPPAALVAPRAGIDASLDAFGEAGRRRSAALLLQEFLNAQDEALWGIATDGLTLRLMRRNSSLTRPAFIEADLARILSEEGLYPDFVALWFLVHQSRFGRPGAAPTDCALERWREEGRNEGTAARERLRAGVEAALEEFGQGFIEHRDNEALRAALAAGELSPQGFFHELLRVVYGLIFLFAAEDRGLLHPPDAEKDARELYAEGYGLARLRERAARHAAHDRHYDVYEGLKVTFGALAHGERRLGLPALGGLFEAGQTPHLDEATIEKRRFLMAIWRLAWIRIGSQPSTKVNWRDMETEELGSVYEGLLELVPRTSASARTFEFAKRDWRNERTRPEAHWLLLYARRTGGPSLFFPVADHGTVAGQQGQQVVFDNDSGLHLLRSRSDSMPLG